MTEAALANRRLQTGGSKCHGRRHDDATAEPPRLFDIGNRFRARRRESRADSCSAPCFRQKNAMDRAEVNGIKACYQLGEIAVAASIPFVVVGGE